MPLCADDRHQILHLLAIHEDIIAVPSVIVALASAGASIRTASNSLVPEHVERSLIAVCLYQNYKHKNI